MRYLFAILLVGSLLSPFAAHAAGTDVYGDSVTTYSNIDLLSPLNAAGAPDGAYADFRDEGTYLTIDMGEGEEGMGDLILTVRTLEFGATVRTTFYDADMIPLGTGSSLFSPSSTSVNISYSGDAYRFVKIESPEEEEWGLDSVQATQVSTPTVEEDTPESCGCDDEESIPYPANNGSVESGTLIRTQSSSAVYLVAQDGKRHAFPNEAVFTSWGYNFSNVTYVSPSVMSSYTLGKNITVRPGTKLVKLIFDPKTYAVEAGGVLRWVKSEAIAKSLYGNDWSERVIDLDEAFWGNYSVGADIDVAGEYPKGTVIADNSSFYLVVDGGYRIISDAEGDLLRLEYGDLLWQDIDTDLIVDSDETNADLTAYYHAY
jgi:hypothetical protein